MEVQLTHVLLLGCAQQAKDFLEHIMLTVRIVFVVLS